MKRASIVSHCQLKDDVGALAAKMTERWLLSLRETNPAILAMFRERDTLPYRDLLPWSGEFAGKVLTGEVLVYRLTGQQKLLDEIIAFTEELISCIDANGYCGCFSKACRLTGACSQAPNVMKTSWDAWSHYHIMYALVLVYEQTGEARFLNAAEKIAGLFLRTFYTGRQRLIDIGSAEMNLSPAHVFCILFRITQKPEYLAFAKNVLSDLSAPEAGDYLNHALKNLPFYQSRKPRWESMHTILAFPEMYHATGDKKYKEAALQILHSILTTDIHNTGAFSTGEQAVGSPYREGSIELCCVIAFNAFAFSAYCLNGDPSIADYLELSFYNAILGSYSTSGHWATYNTPMDGIREASFHTLHFQSRPGSPELNCCSANAARGIGNLSEWMLTEQNGAFFLNYYGASEIKTQSGLFICVTGDYPASAKVAIKMHSIHEQTVYLRIPKWSTQTAVKIGDQLFKPQAGYFPVSVKGIVELYVLFDFTHYLLEGGEQYKGRVSIYYGPILYGRDLTCNTPHEEVCADLLFRAKPKRNHDGSIGVFLPDKTELRDFAHLGATGCAYKSWLTLKKMGQAKRC